MDTRIEVKDSVIVAGGTGAVRALFSRALLLLVVVLFAGVGAARGEENLLANAGFEEAAGAAPAQWDVYLKPMEGASATVSGVAHTGVRSVQLQVAVAYESDPMNNWSQNVMGEFGGKKLRLSGFIKVQAAQDAAILVQCWRKDPWGVLQVASTSTRAPVYGTKEWDETFVEFDAPLKTDFLTVRCVLKGTGAAWFDDVSLTVLGEAETTKSVAPGPDISEMKRKGEKAKEGETRDGKMPRSTLGQEIREQAETTRLREENRMLRDTIDSLKTSNEDLLKRVKSLEVGAGAK